MRETGKTHTHLKTKKQDMVKRIYVKFLAKYIGLGNISIIELLKKPIYLLAVYNNLSLSTKLINSGTSKDTHTHIYMKK